MPKLVLLTLALAALCGCGARSDQRGQCGGALSAAWRELSLAEAEGFAGTVSYSKALGLLTAAKTQQTVEAFGGCSRNAEKARFYIRESRAGR